MFARSVSMRLEANLLAELTRTIDGEVLPLLRNQASFQGEITFAAPGGTEAVPISFWDKEENAEAYSRDPNPQLRKTLENLIEGAPAIQAYEVVNSTFHPIAAQATASFGGTGVR